MNHKESINPFKKIDSKSLYENPWIKVREDKVINPSGKEGIYGVVEFKKIAVAILPIDDEMNTWIVGQYRYPMDSYEWEIPEGGNEVGEDPMVTAKRELYEETGIIANSFEKILEMQLSNSCTNEVSISYIARDLQFLESRPDETEVLTLRKISFDHLIKMVENSEIKDALSIATILKARLILK